MTAWKYLEIKKPKKTLKTSNCIWYYVCIFFTKLHCMEIFRNKKPKKNLKKT